MGNPEKTSTERQVVDPSPKEELGRTVTIDTLHQDEAVKVLARYVGDQTWTPAEEKKLVRQIDKRLMPILCMTYGLQYYDKAMLSQAVSERVAVTVDSRY